MCETAAHVRNFLEPHVSVILTRYFLRWPRTGHMTGHSALSAGGAECDRYSISNRNPQNCVRNAQFTAMGVQRTGRRL